MCYVYYTCSLSYLLFDHEALLCCVKKKKKKVISFSTEAQHNAFSPRSNMVQDHAYIRQRGAHDFMAYYEFACGQIESVPLTSVSMNLHKGSLDFNGDRVKSPEWAPIISSISVNKHLHHIAIRSTHQASGGAAGGGKTECGEG